MGGGRQRVARHGSSSSHPGRLSRGGHDGGVPPRASLTPHPLQRPRPPPCRRRPSPHRSPRMSVAPPLARRAPAPALPRAESTRMRRIRGVDPDWASFRGARARETTLSAVAAHLFFSGGEEGRVRGQSRNPPSLFLAPPKTRPRPLSSASPSFRRVLLLRPERGTNDRPRWTPLKRARDQDGERLFPLAPFLDDSPSLSPPPSTRAHKKRKGSLSPLYAGKAPPVPPPK